jgi:hypothetical protein
MAAVFCLNRAADFVVLGVSALAAALVVARFRPMQAQPLPAALGYRGQRRVLHRPRQQRAGAGLRVLRE